MALQTATPAAVAAQIRGMLKSGGSAEHARDVQWFFKEEIQSHGWYAADLRRVANRLRQEILKQHDLKFLLQVADHLFSGRVLEEKAFAVLLLEKRTAEFGNPEFRLFESWLKRISSWADHDALAHYLLGPLIVVEPRRLKRVFRWAKSRNRWHRRAACVALIQGTRRKLFFAEIVSLSNLLLSDRDDMVQKGLGWLLRETAKANPKPAVRYLMKARRRAPRLVLRTACETIPSATRKRILAG
jgi:3-methyladenine DNA glycosylase AlkD